jgi:hypothetical protein
MNHTVSTPQLRRPAFWNLVALLAPVLGFVVVGALGPHHDMRFGIGGMGAVIFGIPAGAAVGVIAAIVAAVRREAYPWLTGIAMAVNALLVAALLVLWAVW